MANRLIDRSTGAIRRRAGTARGTGRASTSRHGLQGVGRRSARFAVFASACALCLIGAGCADAGSPRTHRLRAVAIPVRAAPKASTASARRRTTAVALRQTAYGRVLVDGTGRALYLFTRDRRPESRCYAACAERWPPFLASSTPSAGAGADVRLLGTARRRNGSRQVTYHGHPLYYYVGDRLPGQVLCQDVAEFGGRWYVVTRSGNAVL